MPGSSTIIVYNLGVIMFGFFKKKPVEKVCGNCRLFDGKNRVCRVFILHEGEKINIPVDPQDSCFFEQEYFDPVTNQVETLNDIKEVEIWVEDEKGQKTDKNGTVKVKYPEGFLGDMSSIRDILG